MPWLGFTCNHDGDCGTGQRDAGSGFVPVGQLGDPNWYNDGDVDGLGNLVDGWSGNSGGWITVSHALDGAAGQTIVLRITFGSDGSVSGFDGVAIDDIVIADAPLPLYPGTNEDLVATLDVNLGGPVAVDVGAEQAQIQVGDFVEYHAAASGLARSCRFQAVQLVVIDQSLEPVRA